MNSANADARGSTETAIHYAGSTLRLGGTCLTDVVEKAGTPVFLLSEARLRANYRALATGLERGRAEVRIRYCAKTNNEAGVLRTMVGLGSHCLASHPAELELARASGFPVERIAYQRPVLGDEEIEAVVECGVSLLHVHRFEDLERIDRIAGRRGRSVDLSLRVRPSGKRLSPVSGLSRRFGFPTEELETAGRFIRDRESLRLAAVNFYLGTQQATARAYEVALAGILPRVKRLRDTLNEPLHELNLGGGIPSPSLERTGPLSAWGRLRDRSRPSGGDEALELERFAARLGEAYRQLTEGAGFDRPPALAVEAGRAIVGNAGLLLARIQAIEGKWVFLDASSNHLGESTLLFRRRILPLERREGPHRFHDLSGSTLNTMDVLDMRRRLPPVRRGDVLAFLDAGAYSISRARRYAGLSPAVYLLAVDGSLRRIRRAEALPDLAGPMQLDSEREEA